MSRFDCLFLLSLGMFVGSISLVYAAIAAEEVSGIIGGFVGLLLSFFVVLLVFDADDCATGRKRYELRDTGNGERHWQFVPVKKGN